MSKDYEIVSGENGIPCLCGGVTVGGTPMPHYHPKAEPKNGSTQND